MCALGPLLTGSSAFAQSDSGFYRGRNVTLIVGYGPGGGYDVYARIRAEYEAALAKDGAVSRMEDKLYRQMNESVIIVRDT